MPWVGALDSELPGYERMPMPNRQSPGERPAEQRRQIRPPGPPPRPGADDPQAPRAGDEGKSRKEEMLNQADDLGGKSGNDLA